MDPNIISMEEGKQILKRGGIPQHDIDKLKEKWEVVACVEALLYFPLKPEKDTAAHRVSDRTCQPSAEQHHVTSGKVGNLKDRKCNIRPTSRTVQKPQPGQHRPVLCSARRAQAPPLNRTLKKQRRTLVKPNVRPQVLEGSTLKCKNCGAFGHMARSTRCPMKTWTGILPFQHLGSKEDKENLNARKCQHPQSPLLISNEDNGMSQIARQEQLLAEVKPPMPPALPRLSPEMASRSCTESIEPCPFLRKRTMPMPVLNPKKRLL